MACNINLFDLINSGGAASCDGSWSLSAIPTELDGTTPLSGSVPIVYEYNTDLGCSGCDSNTGGSAIYSSSEAIPFAVSPCSKTIIIPDTMQDGIYEFTYEVTVGNCTSSVTLNVTIFEGANAGVTVANVAYCSNDTGNYYYVNAMSGGDGTAAGLEPGSSLTIDEATYTHTFSYDFEGTSIAKVDLESAGALLQTVGETPAFLGDYIVIEDLITYLESLPAGSAVGNFTITLEITKDGTDPLTCTNCSDTNSIVIAIENPPNAGVNSTVSICNVVS